MSDKADAAAAPPGGGGGGGSKVMLGLMALNSLLLLAVLALVLLRTGAHASASPAADGDQATAAESHGSAEKKSDGGGRGEEKSGKAEKGEKAAAGAHGPGPMLQLPDFVVHLRDPDTDRYARLTLNVELKSEQDKELVNGRMPQIRDAFLAYLSDRTVEELRGSDGMALVKQDLAKKLNELVPAAPAKALYVTEIVVQ